MSCLLSGIHFRSVAVVVCNIFRRKRIPSFAFNRNLSFKAFNAVLNKSRFLRENVGIFARPKCLWNAKEGGGGMKGDFAQRNPRTPSVTRSIFEKPSRWNFGHYAGSGCKFVPESHFVSSFMPIICILSPPMQFPFSGSGSARETPNKISGQGLRSWKKLYRPMVTLFDKMLHLKAGKFTVTVKNWWQNALITAEEFCNQKCQKYW